MSFWNSVGEFIHAANEASVKLAEETEKLPELGHKASQEMKARSDKWIEEERKKIATSQEDQ